VNHERAKGKGQRAHAFVALCPLPFALCLLPFALSALPLALSALLVTSCTRAARQPPTARAENLLLITIDTLRADHVGAYGYARARTPTVDALARGGALFERAYAAAPITLTSHATLLTGRYPPGHGARDNGLRVSDSVPTLATMLHAAGFRTAAFVAAFPLDHQFGLNRGFDVYSDRMPRGSDGRLMNERPGSQVVDEAIAWLGVAPAASTQPPAPSPQQPAPSPQRFFLWIHLFEPHAPYGDPASGRSTMDRYDDEIATADREVGRLINVLGSLRDDTLIVVAGDHGEAFGEHDEYAHSIFVYDTTLRVPLVMNGPGVSAAVRSAENVTLADVAPTVARRLGTTIADVDGIDVSAALSGGALPARELYAESFAPLVEFGWAPLRSIRSGNWKFIAAPRAELYDIVKDAGERVDLSTAQATVVRQLDTRASRYSPPSLPLSRTIDASGLERLRALGYANGPRHDTDTRIDPKDRREVAARIAQVTSGELTGAALVSALEEIVRVDPSNSQAHLRLGYARLQQGDCAHAEQDFKWAIDGGLPTADAHLGLATCLGRANDLSGAERVLNEAKRREPDNPVITANVGILQAAKGDIGGAIESLTRAVSADPGLLEARFNLAIAFAKAGRRAEAASTARELLARLPPTAPQRAEVERLLRAVQ